MNRLKLIAEINNSAAQICQKKGRIVELSLVAHPSHKPLVLSALRKLIGENGDQEVVMYPVIPTFSPHMPMDKLALTAMPEHVEWLMANGAKITL